MIGLWDTTGNDVVKALMAERRNAGGVTSGLALTLVCIAAPDHVREAEAAATIAAAAHPCRIIIVSRYEVTEPDSRLDAEIIVGGRLGPCEAVVMKMRGRLALHAESVVMPLLAPDVPVVTWWHGDPPDRLAHDPLGVVADRRITDCNQSSKAPIEALNFRSSDYAPGDTDLSWTRTTPWRTLVAGAFDGLVTPVRSITLVAPSADPAAVLLSGWLQARLGVAPTWEPAETMSAIRFALADDTSIELEANNGTAVLRCTGLGDRVLPLVRRPLGEELAEELRRLDPDQIYASALGAATGLTGLDDKPAVRVHVWHDPAVAERPEPVSA